MQQPVSGSVQMSQGLIWLSVIEDNPCGFAIRAASEAVGIVLLTGARNDNVGGTAESACSGSWFLAMRLFGKV
nr:hypothetical protein [uncultured Cohaesibacter sp.]